MEEWCQPDPIGGVILTPIALPEVLPTGFLRGARVLIGFVAFFVIKAVAIAAAPPDVGAGGICFDRCGSAMGVVDRLNLS